MCGRDRFTATEQAKVLKEQIRMSSSRKFYSCKNSKGIRCNIKKHDAGITGYSMKAHCGSCGLYERGI
jgi:SPX domain protein involved in polyphosphate accumulation